ncbi:zinc finger protein OZF-like [Clytia hemisphaerica]|uniref:zinc finger protein OZF-like n=1 Tax=Clytia hemisphaerica TaxID=252671 RepID=UPI0034D79E3A
MNFEIENIKTKSLSEAVFGFSFDIRIDENVVGSCDLAIENIHSQLDLRSNGSRFTYIPNWAFQTANRFFNVAREMNFPFVTNGQEIALRNLHVDNHQVESNEMEPTYSTRTGIYQSSITEPDFSTRPETHKSHSVVHAKDLNSTSFPLTSEGQSCSTITHTSHTNQETSSSHESSVTVEIEPSSISQMQKPNKKDRCLCEKCPKTFASKYHLQRHIKVVHDKVKEFECKECGKYFALKSDLRRHTQSVHEGLKSFQCVECGMAFGRTHHLKKHQLTHTGLKPFQCNECGKLFTDSYSLKMHKASHSGNKPHKCGECEKSFCYIGQLKLHIDITHKGLQLFKCQECGKSYSRKVDLTKHVDNIHKGVVYPCKQCEKTFKNKRNLILHQKKMHK